MDPSTKLHLPTREILRILGIIFGFYVALRLIWIAHPVVFLFFLGVLFGLPLAQGGEWFKKRGIPRGIGVAIILIVFLGLLIGGGASMAPILRTQSKELQQRLPEAMDKIDNWLGHHADGMLGMFVASETPADTVRNPAVVFDSAGILSPAAAAPRSESSTGVKDTLLAGGNLRREITHQFEGAQHSFLRVLTSTFAITGAFMLVLFIAAYIGADPALYHGGILEMFPARERPRVALTLRRVSVVLRRWLVTQLIAMLLIGTVTTLFLVALRVKAALPLGILAGVFKFIPIVGSIFAAIPAIAMAFIDSPHKALVVVIGYIVIQFIENHLLVPVLMKKGVNLPPAMTLAVQALMSVLFGLLGLLVAVPLLAAVVSIARSLNADEMREVSARADAVVGPDPDSDLPAEGLPKTG